jgi:hypothetical protein
MATYIKLPDGTLHELRGLDKPNPEGPGFSSIPGKVLTDLVSGFGQTAALAPKVLGQVLPFDEENSKYLASVGDRTEQYWKEFGKDGLPSGLAKTFTQGAGGGLATPTGAAGQNLRSLAGSMIGPGTAAVGADIGQNTLPDMPGIGGTLGAILGGILGGGLSGTRQSVAENDIRRALSTESPASFTQASKNVNSFNNTGSTTATLAEAFGPDSPLVALAKRAQTGPIDNALRGRIEGRDADVQHLAQLFVDRAGGSVDPNQVANATRDAAVGNIASLKAAAGDALGNRLGNRVVLESQVRGLQNTLRAIGNAEERPDAGNAFRLIADALNNQKGTPMMGLQNLSLAIKGEKNRPINPLGAGSAGTNINSKDLNIAINAAEDGLGDISHAFKQGNGDYKSFMEQVYGPAKEGPMGSLAGSNAFATTQAPASRMQGLITNNSPQTVEGVGRQLNTPGLNNGASVDPTEIARALMQIANSGGVKNPAAALRGSPGSAMDQNLQALLRSGGADASHVTEPLGVIDQLQSLKPEAQIFESPAMKAYQMLIRPFRTVDMAITANTEKGVSREIAEYLAFPTQDRLQKLEEISQYDPAARKFLIANSILQSQQQKGQ